MLIAAIQSLALISTNAYGENKMTALADRVSSISQKNYPGDWQDGVIPKNGDSMTFNGSHAININNSLNLI